MAGRHALLQVYFIGKAVKPKGWARLPAAWVKNASNRSSNLSSILELEVAAKGPTHQAPEEIAERRGQGRTVSVRLDAAKEGKRKLTAIHDA